MPTTGDIDRSGNPAEPPSINARCLGNWARPAEHLVVGKGPSVQGAYTEYNAQTHVELYEGVFDESGRRISMSTENYRASIRAEQLARR